MKALLSWLQEYAPGIEGDPFELGDALSDLGLCCEEVKLIGQGLDGIMTAKVLELSPHPDADRIQLVQVDVGDGVPLQICCGAFNMRVGDVVPLATIGTTMPSGMEISRRKLRGQWSNGMLCSSLELELGDDHDGILILSDSTEIGTPVLEVLGITPDVLFDLDLTPNRPDALSIIGIARDLAAHLGVPFALPDIELSPIGAEAASLASIELVDPDLCGRFTARVLSAVPQGPSSALISRRLELMGMRPINAVVDISNYVMLEYGQPSHTFDLDAVAGGRLVVRRARAEETIDTLDGQTRTLVEADGVIADGNDVVVSIAGVMGGASTEISTSTARILLELAWWDPLSIAATSQRLGLRSEASARFDKGVDPEIAMRAADRFCQLAVEHGATVHPGVLVEEGHLPEPRSVVVRPDRVERMLGATVSADEIKAMIEPIGFAATVVDDDLSVRIPSWRPDAEAEIDVIEEIARHRGYTSFTPTVPASPYVGGLTSRQRRKRRLVDALVAKGLTEVKPMPFLAPGTLERYGVRADAVVVTNPLDASESVLRTALLPGLVSALAYNATHRITGVPLFEVGTCFAQSPPGEDRPLEWEEIGVVLAGGNAQAAVAMAHSLLSTVGIRNAVVTNAKVAGLHPGRAAHVLVGGRPIGTVGEVHPGVARAEGVGERVGWIGLDLDAALREVDDSVTVWPVSRFPSAEIDLAFVVGEDIAAHELAAALRTADPLVVAIRFFDVYRGASLPQSTRSLAYSVVFQSDDRTLDDADVSAARERLIAAAATLGATLR